VATKTWRPRHGTFCLGPRGQSRAEWNRDHFWIKQAGAMPMRRAPAVIGGGSCRRANGAPTAPGAYPMVAFQKRRKIFQVPADQWKAGSTSSSPKQCKAKQTKRRARWAAHPWALGKRHEARRIVTSCEARAGRPGAIRGFLRVLYLSNSRDDRLRHLRAGERR